MATKKKVTKAAAQPKEAAPLTLAEARTKAKKLTDAAKEKALTTLSYIEMLANTSGTDIEDWDINLILKDKGYNISEQELNKNFFEVQKNPPVYTGTDEPGAAPVLTDVILKKLNELSGSWSKNYLKTLQAEQKDAIARAENAQRQAQTQLVKATELQQKIDSFNPKSTGLGKQVVDFLAQDTFWRFEKVAGKFLYLVTTTNVVNTTKDGSRVTLGKYMVEIDTSNLNLKVLPFEGNKIANGHYHPHVTGGGSICWGNGADAARRFMLAGQLPQLMQLMASLLSTYNEAGPYVSLGYFKKNMSKTQTEQYQAGRRDYDDDF